jgi:hypothetical protein
LGGEFGSAFQHAFDNTGSDEIHRKVDDCITAISKQGLPLDSVAQRYGDSVTAAWWKNQGNLGDPVEKRRRPLIRDRKIGITDVLITSPTGPVVWFTAGSKIMVSLQEYMAGALSSFCKDIRSFEANPGIIAVVGPYYWNNSEYRG